MASMAPWLQSTTSQPISFISPPEETVIHTSKATNLSRSPMAENEQLRHTQYTNMRAWIQLFAGPGAFCSPLRDDIPPRLPSHSGLGHISSHASLRPGGRS